MKTVNVMVMSFILFSVMSLAHAEVDYYTCGMHPSVHVSPERYDKGDTHCPICAMSLTPVEKQEEMMMDVGSTGDGHTSHVMSRVRIAEDDLQRAGVKTVTVQKMHLVKEIAVAGTVAFDPALAVAQDEYIQAKRSLKQIKESGKEEFIQRAEALAESARKKLMLLGLNESYIKHVAMGHVAGDLLLPSENMWIYGDVHEHEQEWLAIDQPVVVTVNGFPGKVFKGTVASISPTVDPKTRTIRFRALVENPDLLLKPNAYVNVTIQAHYMTVEGQYETLAIPREAVLDTGRRRLVWVETQTGQFEGRQVIVGPLASVMMANQVEEFYPVLEGVREGEKVVTKGNFLIDSQSQITGTAAAAYGGALGHTGH